MISFDSHRPIRFCSSGHTNQIPPTPNQLSLSLSLDAVIQATLLLLVIANGAINLLFPLFSAVGLQGVVKKAMPLVGGIGR